MGKKPPFKNWFDEGLDDLTEELPVKTKPVKRNGTDATAAQPDLDTPEQDPGDMSRIVRCGGNSMILILPLHGAFML